MIPAPVLAITVAVAVIAIITAFKLGWDISVRRWKDRNLQLAEQYDDMAAKWATLAEAMERDPVRMGLNTGQDYIIRELESFCIQHRERLEKMAT